MFSVLRSSALGAKRCCLHNIKPGLAWHRHNSTLIHRFKAVAPRNLALLVFPCITFYLGVWQVRRRKWKLALIEELDRKRRIPGEEIPSDLSSITPDRQYEAFILHGEFNYSKEIYIGPRTLISDDSGGGLMSNSNLIGVHVVTPLKLRGRTEEVLVNRGWVSMKQKKEGDIAQPKGEQRIIGVYRKTDIGSANKIYDERTNMWARRLVPFIAETLGTEAVFFDMAESKNDVIDINTPIPGQTIVQLRNEHLSYLITWFSLTIILSVIWWRRFMKPSRHKYDIQSMLEESKRLKQLQNEMNKRDKSS